MFLVLGGVVDEHLEGSVTGREVRFGNPSGSWRDHVLRPSFRTALSAARKPAFEWVPSQNGLFVDPPQRQSATVARSTRNSLPSASSSKTGPFTKYGPLSRVAIFSRSVINILLLQRALVTADVLHSSRVPVEVLLEPRPEAEPEAFGFAPSATPMPIRKTSSPPRKPPSEARPTPMNERMMGKTLGSPGAPERSSQLRANSITMTALLNPCPNPIAFARVPEGIASQSIRPKNAARSPPITPAAIIQKAISAHLALPVSRWTTSKITDVVSNPSGKGTSIGCTGCPITLALLSITSPFSVSGVYPALLTARYIS